MAAGPSWPTHGPPDTPGPAASPAQGQRARLSLLGVAVTVASRSPKHAGRHHHHRSIETGLVARLDACRVAQRHGHCGPAHEAGHHAPQVPLVSQLQRRLPCKRNRGVSLTAQKLPAHTVALRRAQPPSQHTPVPLPPAPTWPISLPTNRASRSRASPPTLVIARPQCTPPKKDRMVAPYPICKARRHGSAGTRKGYGCHLRRRLSHAAQCANRAYVQSA